VQEQGLAAHLRLQGDEVTSKAAQAAAFSVSKQGTHIKVPSVIDSEITGCFPVPLRWVSDCLTGEAFVYPELRLQRASSADAAWSPWAEWMLSPPDLAREGDACWSAGVWRLAQLTMPFVFCFSGL